MNYKTHPFKPTLYNSNSKVLILGSFPSIASRKNNFYYQHPKNRFWKILEALFNVSLLDNKDSKENIKNQKAFLKDKKIVLWDVISSCHTKNSSDKDLKDIKINDDILDLLALTSIQAVFLNGAKAKELFYKLCKKHQKELLTLKENNQTKLCIKNRDIIISPLLSTSPANAKYNLKSLIQNWQIIKPYTI